MKKVALLTAILAIFAFSSIAFSAEGAPPLTEKVDVYAEVACYVSLNVTQQPGLLSFSGAPNETKSTTFTTNKKTNCDVNYNVKVSKELTGPNNSTIQLYLNAVGNKEVNYFNAAGSEWNDTFTIIGVTGATSPLAGDYQGEITLTVTKI
ncbi:MAG: hypothetical protein N2202_04205 [Proteobacteria bacterium]|nr:hypothetical protein [Pseudomonadota bacterium]